MWEILFLLLPLSALSGWLIGRKRSFSFHDFFRSRKEKGAELFLQWLESNQESVDTYFTLGNVFRRRGEVDKAIEIHQNLISKPSLTEAQRALSLLELSRDYMRAGMLDRAEQVLIGLINEGQELEASFQHLIDIYQQSKDWVHAINIAEKLQKQSARDMSHQIAHFYCELTEQRWLTGEKDNARQFLNQALSVNPKCVRASLLLGNIEAHGGNYKSAIQAYKRVENQDKAFLSEIIIPLSRCYEALGKSAKLVKYLESALESDPPLSVALAFAEWLQKSKGETEAATFMLSHLQKHPSIRGIHRFMQFTLDKADNHVKQELSILQDLIQKLITQRSLYRCQACGFGGRTLQWQCPGCKRWDVIKPIHE